MSLNAWLTLAVIGAMIVVLARDLVPPSVAVICAVIVLLVAGVVTPAQAFSGFSNPAPITVAALYVLARAVEKTGALEPFVSGMMGDGRKLRVAIARLVIPTAAASSFLNNTPIVAMLVPQVTEWASRAGQSPSRFLMPLSFAAMLGGMLTVIGTSTNLVVSGLLEAAGHAPFTMFELAPIGLPIAVLGIGLLVLLTPILIPERRPARKELEQGGREFVVGMEVISGGTLDGMAVSDGGLRSLQGVFLVEIDRGETIIAPVGPDTVLEGGDRLTFVGRADQVVDLHAIRGLQSLEREHIAEFDTHRHTFFEAVVGTASPLVGRTLKDVGFRGRYQAAVVAIHRAGHRVDAKLGSVRLRVGDTLLLLADPGFRERWRERDAFLLISRLGGSPPAVTRKAWLVGLVIIGLVGSASSGVLPILHAALLSAMALVLMKVVTPGEARNAVDMDVILVIAGAFGLAAALEASGIAALVGELLTDTVGTWGLTGGLFAVAIVTVALKAIVTNNAAAVLVFPIAMSTAQGLGADPRPFAVALAITASASFLTPIAYQTNLMVYGPGGYRFGDYARLGIPLTLLVILAVTGAGFRS